MEQKSSKEEVEIEGREIKMWQVEIEKKKTEKYHGEK